VEEAQGKQSKNVEFPFTEVPKSEEKEVFQDNLLLRLIAKEDDNSSEAVAAGHI
jgi:hypothetical protein